MRKLSAGFAISIDGYILGSHGEMDWIVYDKEHYKRLAEQWDKTDVLLYGRKTYESIVTQNQASSVLKGPFAKMKHYVLSSTLKAVEPGFTLHPGNALEFVGDLKRNSGKNIAVFGGGELAASLINLGVVDEPVLAISPVVLAGGLAFFDKINGRHLYDLKEVLSYSSGLVVITYTAKKM